MIENSLSRTYPFSYFLSALAICFSGSHSHSALSSLPSYCFPFLGSHLPQPLKGSLDGPSIHFGVLGSCAQKLHSSPISCTITQFSPTYDTTVLPSSSNPDVLTALPSSAPVAVLLALVLSTLFFILFAMIAMRSRLGGLGGLLSKPHVSRASAWLGLFGFLIGMTSYLVLRLWFGKMAVDFNQAIAKQGSNGPQLIATVGNAFTMAWVAHAFAAIPLVCAMTKLHVTAAGNKA